MSSASGPSSATAVSPAAGWRRPRTASRGSTPRRSPRRGRAARGCARCAGGTARRRSTRRRGAGARPGRRSSPRARHARDELRDRELVQHLLAPDERRAALVGERGVRDPPALVLRADQVVGRDRDVVEEHLVELVLTRSSAAAGGRRRPARPSGSRASRCPGAAARRGRCAPARSPRSAKVAYDDHTFCPVTRYSSPRRVGAGRQSDARSLPAPGSLNSWHHTSSPDEDPRHPPRPLLVGAVRHQRRPDERDAGPAEQRRRAGARELLVVHRRPAAADAPRPPYSTGQWMPTQPPACSVRCHARSVAASSRVVATVDRRRRVLGEPRPQLRARAIRRGRPASRRRRYGRPADHVTVFSCVYSSRP